MSGRNLPLARNDNAIPEPSYFARQMRWARQGQEAWSWNRLVSTAADLYWQRRPAGRDRTDVAA